MRCAFLAMKGGVAKTTSAVATGLVLASLDPPPSVLLVDCDEDQQSLLEWKAQADASSHVWPETLAVRAWSSRITRTDLMRYDHVVFDLGPKRPELARSVLHLADTAVVPCAPRRADFAELGPAMDVIASAQSRQPLAFAVLLTMVRLGTVSAREARTEAEGLDWPVLDVVIPMSEEYARMFGTVPGRLLAYRDLVGELLAPATEEADHAAG